MSTLRKFLIFQETKSLKKLLIFSQKNCSYILGNFLYFFIIFVTNEIFKILFTKRKLIRYYHFIDIYVIYQNRALFFNFSVIKFYNFLSIFIYGFIFFIIFLIYNFLLFFHLNQLFKVNLWL